MRPLPGSSSLASAWAFFWDCGITTIATAALLFSLGTLAVRFLEGGGANAVPAFQVACIPSACCWLVCGGIAYGQKASLLASTRTVRLLTILRGLFGAASLMLYYISIEMLPLKDAVTLFFCSPVIAVIMEWMVVGDYPSSSSMIGCLFTVAGVFLVTQPNGMDHMPLPRAGMSLGMLCALLAATCNAVAFVIVRALGGRQSAIVLTWWYHLVVMTVTAIPLMSRYPVPAVWPDTRQALLLAGVVGAQFCGQILLNRGFSLVSATRGSAINVLQVVFSYVLELTVLKEDTNLVSLAGTACVMAGVMAVALSGAAQKAVGPDPIEGEHAAGSAADIACQEATYLFVPASEAGRTGKLILAHDSATTMRVLTRPPAAPTVPTAPGAASVTTRRTATDAEGVMQPLLHARSLGDAEGGGGSPWAVAVHARQGHAGRSTPRGQDGGLGTPNETHGMASLVINGHGNAADAPWGQQYEGGSLITRHSFDVAVPPP